MILYIWVFDSVYFLDFGFKDVIEVGIMFVYIMFGSVNVIGGIMFVIKIVGISIF